MKELLSAMITLSVMFMSVNHPLSMGLILIGQTITIAFIIGVMMSSFLLSYIFIIIMLSGSLVLFIYMASIASNEKFQTSVKMTVITPMIYVSSYFMIEDDNTWLQYNSSNIILLKLFNTTSAYITIMMIMYLLMAMIIVSKIAPTSKGPLRIKKYEQTHSENSPTN
uniref:NADH-ubiquinone oxidoreductase chain 6 n=1 Tax=Scaptocoris castanea TaxID=1411909 RepID=A0A343YVR4_9HEMI|nr:NADH dehydrogenase subunit 6 [Scaptocoris castanea]